MDLATASRNGDYNRVQELMQTVPTYREIEDGLSHAISAGHAEIVKLILTTTNPEHGLLGYSLKIAIENGNLEIVKLLLGRNTNTSVLSFCVQCPSSCPSGIPSRCPYRNMTVAILKLFIEKNLFIYHGNLQCIMCNASLNGNIDLIRFILESQLIGTDTWLISIATSSACAAGHFDIVKLLFEKDTYRTSHLVKFAVSSGNNNIVRFLLDNGVKPDYLSLIWACERGNHIAVEWLLNAGISATVENNLPIRSAKTIEVVRLLLERGADATAGVFTVESVEILELLLEHGAYIHINFDRPLQNAISDKRLDIVKRLVKAGANLEVSGALNIETSPEIKEYLEKVSETRLVSMNGISKIISTGVVVPIINNDMEELREIIDSKKARLNELLSFAIIIQKEEAIRELAKHISLYECDALAYATKLGLTVSMKTILDMERENEQEEYSQETKLMKV